MRETDEIRKRYEKRASKVENNSPGDFYFSWYAQLEREKCFTKILERKFGTNWSDMKLMEIGAGTGNNLEFFLQGGFQAGNIWANELLQDRFTTLEKRYPDIQCIPGDATLLNKPEMFDVVLQSTVFTSILDDTFKKGLAQSMFNMVRPGGIILWYDFTYNNPNNSDVKGVGKKEVRDLFPKSSSINFFRVTLAPPLGRMLFPVYNLINFAFPFLRTHIVAEINK